MPKFHIYMKSEDMNRPIHFTLETKKPSWTKDHVRHWHNIDGVHVQIYDENNHLLYYKYAKGKNFHTVLWD